MRVVKHWNGLPEEIVIFFPFIYLKSDSLPSYLVCVLGQKQENELIDLLEYFQIYYCHAEPIHMVEKIVTACLLFLHLTHIYYRPFLCLILCLVLGM